MALYGSEAQSRSTRFQ